MLEKTQALVDLIHEENALTSKVVQFAGCAADELAECVGELSKGTYIYGTGAVQIKGFGMLFIVQWDGPNGTIPVMRHYPVRDRTPESGTFITSRMKPGQECIIDSRILYAAPVSLYVEFARHIELIVAKLAEKKQLQIQDLRSILKTVHNCVMSPDGN
ncbi:hypothetical protein [Alicyclobacillus ferrooxydans]|uniref:Uncharacterized protein n=1 Tax=Alicyclobacillus ferrooxydans TaxID=471514 RepID=A0A0P9EUM3_9BACL|nr:hypothetical protein [Alicyclobacillus ferrooxydans]KPV42668.1 hypothetical protein AN477_16175 [Alicyclobacillus ferrooxydans]